MHRLRLSGTYFDIGFKCGRELKAAGFIVPHANSVQVAFSQESIHEVRRVFPDIIEEIDGLGLGLKANYKDTLAMILTNNVVHDDHSVAFAIGGRKAHEGSLLARNYNRHYKHAGHNMVIKASPRGALASIASSDVPVARQDGINSAGLAIAGSSVKSDHVENGFAPTLAIRAALDTCRDTSSAVQFLTDIKHARNFNFVLADKSGAVGIVEAGPKHLRSKTLLNGSIVATNYFQSARSKGKGASARDTMLKSLVDTSALADAKKAMDILSDHRGMLCEHGADSEFSTVWASVFLPHKSNVVHAEGNPCSSNRRKYSL